MWRARLVSLGLWACAIALLLASIVFIFAVTTAHAASRVTMPEPSPRDAYEQRWRRAVVICANKVAEYTQRPMTYQLGFAGSVPRYTTDRQETLYQVCLDAMEMR